MASVILRCGATSWAAGRARVGMLGALLVLGCASGCHSPFSLAPLCRPARAPPYLPTSAPVSSVSSVSLWPPTARRITAHLFRPPPVILRASPSPNPNPTCTNTQDMKRVALRMVRPAHPPICAFPRPWHPSPAFSIHQEACDPSVPDAHTYLSPIRLSKA